MRATKTFAPLLLSAALAACASILPEGTPNADLTITDADNGKDVRTRIGEVIEIDLAANHTTGYQWSFVPDASTIVVKAGETPYVENTGNALGRGGVEKWFFRANRAGTQSLRFEYRRPFEPNSPPARTAVFHIRVN